MILLALLLAAAEPPRQTGVDVATPQPIEELQACVMRKMMKGGRVTAVPMTGGVSLDFQEEGLIGASKVIFAIEIRDAGEKRHLTAVYRHPWSAKIASNLFKSAAKACFPDEYAAAYPPK